MHINGVRSIRAMASKCPAASVTAMVTTTDNAAAFSMAAAITRCAAARVAERVERWSSRT
jgi:hypothetical protein